MPAAGRSKPLEDRQERRLTGVAEHLDAPAQRLLGTEGNDELVLEEALAPVDAVPLSDTVERVEEGRDALDLASALSRGLAVPRLVEGGDGGAVQQAARNSRRRDCQLLGPEVQGMATQPPGELLEGRRPASGQDRTPQRGPAGEAIDPGDRVGVPVVPLALAGAALESLPSELDDNVLPPL